MELAERFERWLWLVVELKCTRSAAFLVQHQDLWGDQCIDSSHFFSTRHRSQARNPWAAANSRLALTARKDWIRAARRGSARSLTS
jgi:hypothetical protein